MIYSQNHVLKFLLRISTYSKLIKCSQYDFHYRVWSVLNSQNTRHIHIQKWKCKNKRNSTHYRAKYKGLSDHGLSPAEWAETFRAPALVSRAFVWAQGGRCRPILQRKRETLGEKRFLYNSARTEGQTHTSWTRRGPRPYASCLFVSLFQPYLLPKALSHPPLRDAFPSRPLVMFLFAPIRWAAIWLYGKSISYNRGI